MHKPNILNITNGDSSVAIMQQAGISGAFLPWRDVLHEGPVPDQLSLDELSVIRAKFICDRGWGEYNNILNGFKQRDATLASFKKYNEVVLWFEHDLYDQLQILQILDWFANQKRQNSVLSIICTNQYLGLLSPEQMIDLQRYKLPVSDSMLSLASQAWNAFRSDSPIGWGELLHLDLSALPFLKDAVVRLLQEYPSASNGLSRTAMQALTIIADNPLSAHEVFKQNQALEDGIFMGDSSFRMVLQQLISCTPALITLTDNRPLDFPQPSKQQLNITETGKKMLAGGDDFLLLADVDHWIGGVHLQANNLWRWDEKSRKVSAV